MPSINRKSYDAQFCDLDLATQQPGRYCGQTKLSKSGKPHSGRWFLRDTQGWSVPHQGALKAYVDWTTFERNQEQMAANRTRYSGTPRGAAALLGGLVTCGLCGRRMFTNYNENGREARYVCHQMATAFGAPRCQSIIVWPWC